MFICVVIDEWNWMLIPSLFQHPKSSLFQVVYVEGGLMHSKLAISVECDSGDKNDGDGDGNGDGDGDGDGDVDVICAAGMALLWKTSHLWSLQKAWLPS